MIIFCFRFTLHLMLTMSKCSILIFSLALLSNCLIIFTAETNHIEILPDLFNTIRNHPSSSSSSHSNSFYLNPLILQKSILNVGQLSLSTQSKLKQGKCLNILAIGGSVTCGKSEDKTFEDRPHGIPDSYHHALLNYMNELWPACHAEREDSLDSQTAELSNHTLTVLCEGGVAQDYWIDRIMILNNKKSEIVRGADIILVETSVNEVASHTSPEEMLYAQRNTELLLLMLVNLVNQPSVIFLGTSFQFGGKEDRIWRDTEPRDYDGVYAQLSVAKHYNVPYVSALDALGPFITPASVEFLRHVYMSDQNCHISKTGHRMVGYLVFNQLNQFILSYSYPLHLDTESGYISPTTVPLLHWTKEEVKMYLQSSPPLVITLNSKTIARTPWMIDNADDWEMKEDVTGKPGFISEKVKGQPFILYLRSEDVNLHFIQKRVHVMLLKSYENMGTVRVMIESYAGKLLLAERNIDCQWDSHTSQLHVEEFIISKDKIDSFLSFGDPKRTDLKISFTVVPSDPVRMRNKIKLISVTIL